MKHRPEIDGLRVFAVVPVVLFHAGISWMQGGYIGVDVFFVISGFLISTIILEESARGEFSIARFYERRARRILPALFAVSLACIPLAWWLLLPHQLKDFGQSLFATNLFVSNIFFIFETNYFNEFAHLSPLLHTWSLSVEEQYYIFYPLVLAFIACRWPRLVLPALGAMVLSSVMLSEIVRARSADANFYLMPTRAWQLVVGGICAVHLLRYDVKRSSSLTFVGLALILGSAAFMDASVPSPSLWSWLPVGGTALVLLFAPADGNAGRILTHPAARFIGLSSYSAYLWHQPLLAFARVAGGGELAPVASIAVGLLAFPVGLASWRWIENPLRNVAVSRRTIFATGIAGSLALAALGYSAHLTQGYFDFTASRVPVEARHLVIDREGEFNARQALFRRHLPTAGRHFSAGGSVKRVLILGDSKSQDLYVSLVTNDSLFPGFEFRQLSLDDSCMDIAVAWIAREEDGLEKSCRSDFFRDSTRRMLEKADMIVLTNSWQFHTTAQGARLARSLAASGTPVVVLSTANFNDVPSLAMGVALGRAELSRANEYFFDNIRVDWESHSESLRRAVDGEAHVRFVEKLEAFCDFKARSCKLFDDNGRPLVFDTGHVTVAGAGVLARRTRELGWLDGPALSR